MTSQHIIKKCGRRKALHRLNGRRHNPFRRKRKR